MDEQQARLWLAIVLSMLVWLAYDHYVLGPARETTDQTPVVEDGTAALPAPDAPPQTAPPSVPPMPGTASAEPTALHAAPAGEEITIETPLYSAAITPRGGRLVSFRLKRYRTGVAEESPPLELVAADGAAILPLTLWIGANGQDAAVEYSAEQTTFVIGEGETADVVLTGVGGAGERIAKTVRFDGGTYLLGLDVSVSGGSAPPSISLVVPPLPNTGGYSYSGDQAVGIAEGRLIEHSVDGLEEEVSTASGVDWAGFSGTYFASVGVPVDTKGTAIFGAAGTSPIVRLDVAARDGVARYLVLMGPKDREILAAYGRQFERLIDFGWFWFIASPMLWLLHRINDVVRNYGIAIVVITILLKIVTYPLNQKSITSMRKMQEIQPLMKGLQERHKDDPTGMQRAMMELYKKHNVNPFSGCLPMLVQIPIFIALYNGLLRDIALRHAPFVGWINDLSAPDRLYVAGIGVPVLTLLMGASMLLQQVTAPAQGDPTQRRMMMIMPVVFTFMFINFPSGLVLYWLVNNVISIGQQYLALRPTT